MSEYKPPLSAYFVWHPADADKVKPLVDHCSSMLQRDVDKPFSRAMNLPVFYRTSLTTEPPLPIVTSSTKTVIFAFVSTELAAQDIWMEYVKSLPKTAGTTLIPIALDKASLVLRDELGKKNFIRLYDYEEKYEPELMFIAIAHEIYRFTLNKNFNEMAVGKDNAIKLFLSHSKTDDWAIKLALALKAEIDCSAMRTFFDAYDIAAGYTFDDEIIQHISDSTFISIHSDSYSSRYWCQREVLTAKEKQRPVIAVDCLDDFEDRRFPCSGNIPAIHIAAREKAGRRQLLKILCAALLETVRYHYNQYTLNAYRASGWYGNDTLQLTRPPEISDLASLLELSGGQIKAKHRRVVYPEPPVYTEELDFLCKLNINAHTPLTVDDSQLAEHHVGISISSPTEFELIAAGLGDRHLKHLSQDISRHLLSRRARVIYGGDLRADGFTEFILNEAMVLQSRLKSADVHVDNYLAWPIYNSDTKATKDWKVKYKRVVKMHEVAPPDDVFSLIPNRESGLVPCCPENSFVWSRCLTQMREQMIGNCTIRICAGGKSAGYKGKMPGVLEEILIAIEKKRPLFLLGGFGGITAKVCGVLQGQNPCELTEAWQVQQNAGYGEFMAFAKQRDTQYVPDYAAAIETIKGMDNQNGLTEEENRKLYATPFVDEALHLILKGLKQLMESK